MRRLATVLAWHARARDREEGPGEGAMAQCAAPGRVQRARSGRVAGHRRGLSPEDECSQKARKASAVSPKQSRRAVTR